MTSDRLFTLIQIPANVSSLDETIMSTAGKLLLIEDHDDVRLVFALMLKDKGYDVISCQNGEEGLKALEAVRPDVAVIDVALPDMDGFEVISKIREMEKQNPWQSSNSNQIITVSLTGHSGIQQKVDALSAGSDLHFVKPIDLELVCDQIDAIASQTTV